MRYYLDTEFDGFNGPLLSIGIVREDGESLYATTDRAPHVRDKWVAQNVVPILRAIPSPFPGAVQFDLRPADLAALLEWYFAKDEGIPYIVTDWPDDIAYLSKAIITGPGQMVSIPRLRFDMVRVDPYEAGSAPADAVRHNAYWDAVALRAHVDRLSATGE